MIEGVSIGKRDDEFTRRIQVIVDSGREGEYKTAILHAPLPHTAKGVHAGLVRIQQTHAELADLDVSDLLALTGTEIHVAGCLIQHQLAALDRGVVILPEQYCHS